MTGPKNEQRETTWGGLAKEVRYWGEWVLKEVKAEIGDLYPVIPDPSHKGKQEPDKDIFGMSDEVSPGFLVPVAYLWTRTVTCKNPTCKATVPLVRQTWLCKKKDRYVALKMVAAKGEKQVHFEVVESRTEKELVFDPAGFSKAGNATCPFCGTVADNDYAKEEGKAGRIDSQPMAVVCTRPGERGKVYLSADALPPDVLPNDDLCRDRIAAICKRTGITVPDEPIINDAKNANFCILYGLDQFSKLLTSRQLLTLLTLASAMRDAHQSMTIGPHATIPDRAKAVTTFLAAIIDRIADWNTSLCSWSPENTGGAKIGHTFGRQALPMVWDFAESGLWGDGTGSAQMSMYWVLQGIDHACVSFNSSVVSRGSSTDLPLPDRWFDAVITDPPYYDNVPYANISDFFYVWLKRTIGYLYPEHFATPGTPKKQEAVADATRHRGDKKKAVRAYEDMMTQSLAEAHRVLKPSGILSVVYAHKTTLGWTTLVDAFRRAGFTITEAWPLDTEMKARMRAMDSAALATSIFLVGRKREGKATGSYETDVQPELEAIVRERVETLWDQGISGADLVIACVGAGLRAFTRFARVGYANGEEVPAERFLTEVETVVLDSILGRLSKEVGGNGGSTSLAGVDPATRFYTLWRYTYRGADLDAGEAIIFANGTHVELDGPSGVSSGSKALVEKKKGKYRLRDYKERGDDDSLGKATEAGQPAPLIDGLHRTLWLMENRPLQLAEFLREAQPNRDQMRLVAQALAGPALKGGEMADISPTGEMAALAKLTANWRSVIEDNVVPVKERVEKKRGQGRLF